MRIGGIVKTTLIDYPGKVASMIFTTGCNFACPWCHNGGLLSDSEVIEPGEVLEFLLSRKHLIDGVVLSGGEPTLQKGLEDFILSIRDMGLSIKLDTNGSTPDLLEKILAKGLIDYVAMDVKSSLADYRKVTGVAGQEEQVEKSIKLIMESAPDYEFRTTVVPGLHDIESIHGVGRLVQGSKIHYLQAFRPVDTVLFEGYRFSRRTTERELNGYADIMALYVKEVRCRT